MAAGYFNGSLGVGEAIGPIVASLLVAKFDFRPVIDGLALAILIYTILFFFFNGRSEIFHNGDASDGTLTATDGSFIEND